MSGGSFGWGLIGMSNRRRKPKQGELFAIEASAKAHAIPPELVQAAREVRSWTDGPRPTPWRVLKLARAMMGHG